jgi:malonate-semialdehyde dehydrogenase (acetylating)/methylmalonate-semialdehyde dehydrogenase
VGKVADPLLGKLAEAASALRVGPGDRDDTDMGPVIRRERKQELIAQITGAESQAELVTDGRQGGPEQGFFLGPTILDRVTPAMDVWKEELFGPVLAMMRAADLDEALKIMNQSAYGNQASIFTTSGKSAREFERRAEAGMLGINIGVAAAMAFFPFTGWKRSFLGDLHATGADAVRFYTRQKIVTTRWF